MIKLYINQLKGSPNRFLKFSLKFFLLIDHKHSSKSDNESDKSAERDHTDIHAVPVESRSFPESIDVSSGATTKPGRPMAMHGRLLRHQRQGDGKKKF